MEGMELEVYENRQSRNLENGPGPALIAQVDARNNAQIDEDSKKYYKRQGASTLAGFNRMQMFKDGVNLQTREDGSYVVPNKYVEPGTKTLFGIDSVSGKKITDISSGPAYMIPLRVVAGAAYDAASGAARAIAGPNPNPTDAFSKQLTKNVNSRQEPEWLQKSSGVVEDMGRTLAQFVGGYAAAGKSLAKTGISGVKKDMAASVASGQTFDPAEGNLATLLEEYGMLPETLRYLDSKMATKELGDFQGRMAMAFEEVGLGGGVHVVGKMLRSMGKSYAQYGDTLMQEGVKQYNLATGSLNHPSLGSQRTELMHENLALEGMVKVAGGLQIKKGTIEQFLDYAQQGGIDEKLAKRAWNVASVNKLERLSGYVSKSGPGPIARQKGTISMFDGESTSSAATPADFQSVAKYFEKQKARGNIQKSEIDDSIKPAMEMLKDKGVGVASPQQIMQVAKAQRPEFKTITKDGEDSKFDRYQYHPYEGTEPSVADARPALKLTNSPVNVEDISIDYKEHLFIARNDATEGGEGFMNSVHFSEPFVKGVARTSLMGKVMGKRKFEGSKIFIQELQSDSASAARMFGEQSDKQIQSAIDEINKKIAPENADEEFSDIVSILTDKLNLDSQGKQGQMAFHLMEKITHWMREGDKADINDIRQFLATPSAFNQDKAWIRQTIRPVIEDAIEQKVNKIVLASKDVIGNRWGNNGAEDLYLNKYPKILKQYFKDIGVPDRDIHMPKQSSDTFWVELPKEVMEGAKKLPQYSIAGSAPLTIQLGEENDK